MKSIYADYSPFNKIEDYLYMGEFTVVLDASTLHQLNVKHILSLIDDEIPNDKKVRGITYKHINVDDSPEVDLLTYMPECYLFISKAQQSRECVYVHCHAGVSRSATIVISFLMKKYSMPFSRALSLVKSKRFVSPNYGFAEQLDLYEHMGFKIDANNRRFREFLITNFMSNLGFTINHNSFIVGLKTYFAKLLAAEKGSVLVLGPSYYCSKCRDKLFNDINIVKNKLVSAQKCCTNVYIEPRKWMINSFNSITNDNRQGTIKCHCNNVLGKFDFSSQEWSRCKCPLHNNSYGNCLLIKIVMANVIKVT